MPHGGGVGRQQKVKAASELPLKNLMESGLLCQTQPSSAFGHTQAEILTCVWFTLLRWLRAASASTSEISLGGTNTSCEVTRQAMRDRASDFFSFP